MHIACLEKYLVVLFVISKKEELGIYSFLYKWFKLSVPKILFVIAVAFPF